MRISSLVWDADRERHLMLHGITTAEIVEALADPDRVVLRARSGERSRRYLFLSRTEAGRYVFLVIEERTPTSGEPVTARGMTRNERRRYARGR